MLEALSLGQDYYFTRLLLQRGLAFIYLIAFLIVCNQSRALIGANGLLPAQFFIRDIDFFDSPSLFYVHFSDGALIGVGLLGALLSLAALGGISESFGPWVSVGVWLTLWLLYLSIVNIGQVFYGYGWETLLLESGFLAIFLGSRNMMPQPLVIWLYRWLLFRLMFGAGLIKIRGDACWRDLTCMVYHYETQPLPSPLSWYFHQLPVWVHRAGVLFTHFVELILPFGLFGPGRIRIVAGLLTIFFQGTLIASGNLSWLNCITVVIGFSCLDDKFLKGILTFLTPPEMSSLGAHQWATYALSALVAYLSFNPIRNLISPGQAMNASFEPLHLVNTYGAFGSITKIRNEIVIEGSSDSNLSENSHWIEYEFKGKPGSPRRSPRFVTPYHFKIDWQMWFAAMSPYPDHPWIVNLVAKLLQNDPVTLSLLAKDPFPDRPPEFVRARLYEYHFAPPGSQDWWTRKLLGDYLPPLSLKDESFRRILKRQGWLEN